MLWKCSKCIFFIGNQFFAPKLTFQHFSMQQKQSERILQHNSLWTFFIDLAPQSSLRASGNSPNCLRKGLGLRWATWTWGLWVSDSLSVVSVRAEFKKCKIVYSFQIEDFGVNKNEFRHGQTVLKTTLTSSNTLQKAFWGPYWKGTKFGKKYHQYIYSLFERLYFEIMFRHFGEHS